MITKSLPFLTESELSRARRRAQDPRWRGATEALRSSAETLIEQEREMPAFDSAWYDADPDRDYAETYTAFADYAFGTRFLAGDAMTLLKAAAVFDEDRYAARAMAWMGYVVDRFGFHVRHHDAGLCYSILTSGLTTAYVMCGDRLDADARRRWREQLTAAGEAICASREHWRANLARMPYNNHLAAHQAGLLSLGLALDRADWIDLALTGRGSFPYILPGCTRDEGLCYESSTSYHFATLGGLLRTAELVRHAPHLGRDLYNESFANGASFKQMFDAPLELMLPNGELPSLGDCYARRSPQWRTRQGLYEIAFAVYGDPRYAWLIERGGPRESLSALLYGADDLGEAVAPTVRSRVWIEHGYALLTSAAPEAYWADDGPAVAAVLTGDRSGVHYHNDSLSAQVFADGRLWVEDVESEALAANGFADPIQERFNRTVWAHNTVVVDEQDQRPIDRPLAVTTFKDLPACKTVAMADREARLFDGARLHRSLAVTEEYGLDLLQAASDAERTYDWLVHPRADGPARGELTWRPFAAPADGVWSILTDVEAADVDAAGLHLLWDQDGRSFRMDVAAGLPGQCLRASWPVVCDGSGGSREMFFYRVRADRADFVALYQVQTGAVCWRVESARRAFNGDHDEFHITVTDGQRTRTHIFEGL